MVAATMPKGQKKETGAPNSGAAPVAGEPEEQKEQKEQKEGQTTLKVAVSDAELVGKIAAHRGKSVAKLFKDRDIQDFFTHLLLEEMRKESERLKNRKS